MVDSYLSTKFRVYSIHSFGAPRVHGRHQKVAAIQYMINSGCEQPELKNGFMTIVLNFSAK